MGFCHSTSRMTYMYVCVESWMSCIPQKVDRAKNRKSMTSYQTPIVFYVLMRFVLSSSINSADLGKFGQPLTVPESLGGRGER